MPIYARELSVENYRNFEEMRLRLDESVTVLVGRNAVGKTNLVEALQLLTSGVSFRRPSPTELVRDGRGAAHAALRLSGEGRVIDLSCSVVEGKRSFRRNGKRCTAAGVRGVIPSVLFCPDDLDMVKRSASVRRGALDAFGVQLSEQYAKLVSSYERIVEQRNSLLKEPWCSREVLAAWNDSLVQAGASLMVHRMSLLARIQGHLVAAYQGIAPDEKVEVAYEPSMEEYLGGMGLADAGDPSVLPVEEVRSRFRAALDAASADELRRRVTLVGPHRDEIRFSIDGRDARSFASQGQQRSLVLSWKLAEVDVTRDILGYPPLLLLDDVMSELDAPRREAFLHVVRGEVQTVITTTNLGYFSEEVLRESRVVRIGGE